MWKFIRFTLDNQLFSKINAQVGVKALALYSKWRNLTSEYTTSSPTSPPSEKAHSPPTSPHSEKALSPATSPLSEKASSPPAPPHSECAASFLSHVGGQAARTTPMPQ